MTHENLELREWLAVNLMGWDYADESTLSRPVLIQAGIVATYIGGSTWQKATLDSLPKYESTWDGVGLIVDAMRARGYALDLRVFDLSPNTIPSRARFDGDGPGGDWSEHQHAPMAVALAARTALEGGK